MNVRTVRRAMLLCAALLLLLGTALQNKEIPITTTSAEARSQIEQAQALIDEIRFAEAVPLLKRAVEIDPMCAYAHYLLAIAVNTPAETRSHLDKAVALAGTVSNGEKLLIQSLVAQVNGNPAEGETLLRDAVAQYPNDKRALVNHAAILMTLQRYNEAATQLQAAIAVDRNFAPAYNQLGYVEMRRNKLADAETAFRHYVSMVPNQPNPHDSFGELLLKEGKFDDAITSYTQALTIDQKFYSSRLGIAMAYTLKGMNTEARKHLQLVVDNSADNGWKVTALQAIAGTFITEGEFDKAQDALKQAHGVAVTANDPVLAAQILTTMGTTALQSATIDASKGTYLKTRTPEVSRIDQADAYFTDADKVIAEATLPRDTKDVAKIGSLVNTLEVALLKNNITSAKTIGRNFDEAVRDRKDDASIRLSHQVHGMIAMGEKDYTTAIRELNQANLRDPLNLWRLVEANEAAGNTTKAQELRRQIWNFNEINFNLAFVRPLTRPQ